MSSVKQSELSLMDLLIAKGVDFRKYIEGVYDDWWIAQDDDGCVCIYYDKPIYKGGFTIKYWCCGDDSDTFINIISLNIVANDNKTTTFTLKQFFDYKNKQKGVVYKSVDSVGGVYVRLMNSGWVEVENNSIDHLLRELQSAKDLVDEKRKQWLVESNKVNELNEKILGLLKDKGLNI